MLVRNCIAASFLAVLAFGCAQTHRAAMPAGVCEIASRPEKYNNLRVVIRAGVRATLHHQLVLTDASCDRLITINAPQQLAQETEFKALMATVYRGFPHDVGTPKASGVFRGTLRYRANEVPSIWLELHSIENLRSGVAP